MRDVVPSLPGLTVLALKQVLHTLQIDFTACYQTMQQGCFRQSIRWLIILYSAVRIDR